MVASAGIKNINKFLDRVDEITNEPDLKDIRVTFDEFSHGKVNGLLTKQDFQRAAYHFGDMVLRLLSWVILAMAMSRCHGCLEAERLALLQIKASINHPNGTSLPGWKDDYTGNCCDWPGVVCHKATRFVVELQLINERQNKLGDWCLNVSLFRPFESLAYLRLDMNQLVICNDDEGVENQLSKLRNLEVLDLGENNLDSRVLLSINGLTSLRSLDLSFNRLNSSIHLKDMSTSGPLLLPPDPSKFPPAPPPELQVHHLHCHHHSGRDAGVAGEDGGWVVGGRRTSGRQGTERGWKLRWGADEGRGPVRETVGFGIAAEGVERGLDLRWHTAMASSVVEEEKDRSRTWAFEVVLDLTDTQLDNSILSSLHGLSSLRCLNLSVNNLGGSFHMRDSIGGFGKLSLSLRNLEELHLDNNQLDNSILSSLHGFSSLKSLYLDENNLKGSSHAQDSTGGFRNLSLNLRNLEELGLSYNQLDNSILSSLHGFSSLKGLYLADNNLKGSSDMQDSTGGFRNLSMSMRNLEELSLSYNQLDNSILSSLDGFSSLKGLYVADNNLKWSSHMQVYTLTFEELQWADTFQNIVVEELIQSVTKSIPVAYLEYIISDIDLSCNNFSGHIPPEIGKLFHLKSLNLSHNSLSGTIPITFANLTGIESLDLSYNKLRGNIPSQLTKLDSLEAFNVSFNDLSGPIPEGPHFETFDGMSYVGNQLLCGKPVSRNCTDPESAPVTPRTTKETEFMDMDTFYVSFATAYITMLLAVFLILCINPYWRPALFHLVEVSLRHCYYFVVDNLS
ncbi:hypothetical protein RJ639_035526 [Escallonia herrerae]|uniref:Leucine-rich repeat-containing N-terminal plant-type domain-containing protein n=1 Tax=Escallonia herrerae TaxID=1293975 RepID=A0AA89B9Q9_9ASTE|nr:hypothetical protein RJ639_035526 [Escallonia herrerae]